MKTGLFANTWSLVRFILRRDRVRLLVWLLCLAGFTAGLVPVFDEIISSGSDAAIMAEMMENPAMIAIVGPVYGADNYTVGASFGNMMLIFCVMLAGIMSSFLVSRHTRQDEELGRLELVRSLPVGRLSNLASALVTALGVNIVLALITGLGMYALREEGMTLGGCMLFGAAMGATGLFFAAVTAVLCQFTANNRTANGLALFLLLALYLMRAAGDIGREALSLASPLGLILRIESFVNDYWWPVFVILAVSIALAALALILAQRRDLGRGLMPDKAGRHEAGALLASPLGLALRLLRTPIIVWCVTVFVLGASYGSVLGDMDSFIENSDMLKLIFAADPDFSMIDQFIVLLTAIMSIINAIPVVMFTARVISEERNGHMEHLLARSVSRRAALSSYVLPALALGVVLQVLSALGVWLAAVTVLDSAPALGVFMASAMSYVPALAVTLALTAFLAAFLPELVSASYAYLGYAFASIYLGSIAGFPDWMKWLTPFGHIPAYPVEKLEAAPLVVLSVIAVVLGVLAFWRYRERDIKSQ